MNVAGGSIAAAATGGGGGGGRMKSLRNEDVGGESDKIERSISVKDVISVLGREIQMSRSTLIYRLYEKVRSDSE